MRILILEAENFRGIKKCNIKFPENSRLAFLIGAGDTTKSTILNAIQWILWPTWNLASTDTDFYNKNTDEPIVLRGTFSEIPEELISEEKYGMYLRKPGVEYDGISDDEPCDNLPVCLTVQLTIDSSLEPKWEVVCNRKEPVSISNNDRRKLSIGVIGNNCARDLLWGKNSVLQKYADSRGTLHDAYIQAIRDAAQKADLSELNSITDTVIYVGKNYGVSFEGEISNKLIYQNGSYTTDVGIYEGDIPLSQKGTGSQRLLSMGLNIGKSSEGTLLIIDEIETGLEPYRLKSLINTLRENHHSNGQVIATTHSPIAVSEAILDELMFITHKDGVTRAAQLYGKDLDRKFFQGEIRKNAESFLTKRLIVCEGKTEIGFVRALDSYLQETQNLRMAFYGVGPFLGGGENVLTNAETLKSIGYDVVIFMDSDKESEEPKKQEAKAKGLEIIDWEKPYAIEQQIFKESTIDVANQLLKIAVEEKSIDSIVSKLTDISYEIDESGNIKLDNATTTEQLVIIGGIAMQKKCSWYKRIDLGEAVGNTVFRNYDSFPSEGRVKTVVKQIEAWVKKYEGAGNPNNP